MAKPTTKKNKAKSTATKSTRATERSRSPPKTKRDGTSRKSSKSEATRTQKRDAASKPKNTEKKKTTSARVSGRVPSTPTKPKKKKATSLRTILPRALTTPTKSTVSVDNSMPALSPMSVTSTSSSKRTNSTAGSGLGSAKKKMKSLNLGRRTPAKETVESSEDDSTTVQERRGDTKPTANQIEWESVEGIKKALLYDHDMKSLEGVPYEELVVMLADSYPLMQLRVRFAYYEGQVGVEAKHSKCFEIKTKKKLIDAFKEILVQLKNARTNLNCTG